MSIGVGGSIGDICALVCVTIAGVIRGICSVTGCTGIIIGCCWCCWFSCRLG